MNNRTLRKLFIVLIILISIWIIRNYWIKNNQSQVLTEGKIDLPLSSSEINKIQIEYNENQISLQKRDNIWFIEVPERSLGDDRAVMEDVNQLLSLLDPIQIKLISANPNRHTELSIDAESAGKINYFTDQNNLAPQLVLLISSDNPKLFRQDQMVNVYQWSNDLTRIIQQSVDTWTAPTPTPTITATE